MALTVNRLMAALCLMAAFTFPVPEAVAGTSTTRVVDDDGRGTRASCDALTSTYDKVNQAVEASSDGDTVLVCPGVYTETIYADVGVTIAAATDRRPTIRAPRTRFDALLEVPDSLLGHEVTIRGLRFQTHGGIGECTQGPLVRISDPALSDHEVRIVNTVFAASEPYGSSCGGYDTAIRVTAVQCCAIVKVDVMDSIFRDFNRFGISVFVDGGSGGEAEVTVDRSRFAIDHKIDPKKSGEPKFLQGPFAVSMNGCCGVAEVTDSVMISNRDRFPISGILADGSFERNAILNARFGIVGSGRIVDNVLMGSPRTKAGEGIWVAGGIVSGNKVSGFAQRGILVTGGSQISDNDFRENRGIDCVERDAFGPAATWVNNLGLESRPRGLCKRAL